VTLQQRLGALGISLRGGDARRIWGSAAVLLLVTGLLSSVLQTEPPATHGASSYGVVPFAWGAAYDLLDELQLGVSRSRAKLTQRRPGTTQWLIEPSWSEHELAYELSSVEQFAQRGGTVLIIGADFRLWKQLGVALVASAVAPDSTASANDRQSAGKSNPLYTPPEASDLTGSWLAGSRSVELSDLSRFDLQASADFTPRVRVGDAGFVLERAIGSGRLVLVAGSDFLTNQRLSNAENAPFLVDLARAYGPAVFDERCHGFTEDSSPIAALGAGFVGLLGLALFLLTVSSLLSARRWPLPTLVDGSAPPPTLEVFVSSLASLYRARGRRQPGAVFRAYRAGFMRRLQRVLFGQREISHVHFEARVQREASLRGADGAWLRDGAQPVTAAELTQAVAALERYAAATQHRRQA